MRKTKMEINNEELNLIVKSLEYYRDLNDMAIKGAEQANDNEFIKEVTNENLKIAFLIMKFKVNAYD